MHRNIIILAKHQSPLRAELESKFSASSDFIISDKKHAKHVNPDNVLFIDCRSFEEAEITTHAHVRKALAHGVPVIIFEPGSTLLQALTGLGVEGVEAAIVIQGKGQTFYTKTFMQAGKQRILEGHESMVIPVEQQTGDNEEDGAEAANTAVSHLIEEVDSRKSLIRDLTNFVELESALDVLARGDWQDSNVPANRKWSHYWEQEWRSVVLSDPSGEQSKTQTARFRYTVIFNLLAANTPVKKKILNVAVGGQGFEPVLSGQSLIRDNDKHRGWAQSMTFIEFNPANDHTVFGNIQDYLPSNTAGEVQVVTGYSWDIGFSAGGSASGPEGSVNFSYSKNNSSTISTKDFETLAVSVGRAGMRFFHNTRVVGGDTFVDPREFGFFSSGWTGQMAKMFYYHFPDGDRVRFWPSLSKSLLKPGCECIWYASPDETRTATLNFTGAQGMNYFYVKGSTRHCSNLLNQQNSSISINMSRVNYNDPK